MRTRRRLAAPSGMTKVMSRILRRLALLATSAMRKRDVASGIAEDHGLYGSVSAMTGAN